MLLTQMFARLRLCEVEIYQEADKTDIGSPSFDSGWLNYTDYYMQFSSTGVEHGLKALPLYGRLLGYNNHSLNIYQFGAFEMYDLGYNMGDPITLEYNDRR